MNQNKITAICKTAKALESRLFNFVVPLGFEPRAAGLENLCSIQLSYGTGSVKTKRKVNKRNVQNHHT